MSYIFTSKPFSQSSFKLPGGNSSADNKLADILEPKDEYRNGVDVVRKFNWTYSPINETTVKEVPYIKLTEFYLLESNWNQLFRAYGRNIPYNFDGPSLAAALATPLSLNTFIDSEQLYQGLYDHINPTGFTYKFPYFDKNYLNTNNTWTSTPMFKEMLELQLKFAGFSSAIAAAIGGAIVGAIPYFGQFVGGSMTAAQFAAKWAKRGAEKKIIYEKEIELATLGLRSPVRSKDDPAIDKPYLWSTTTPRSFNVMFPLYNTLTQPKGRNWYANIVKNWELCYLLCYQNLYNKRNLFTGIPPVFYEIDIPGIHYSKAGYISNLKIFNVGNIRKLNLPINGSGKEVNVPDAYMINMTVTDFFIPSKNFMSSLCNKNKSPSLVGSIEGDPFERSEPITREELEAQSYPFGGDIGGRRDTPGDLGCWVAREVYGINDYRWVIFRNWLYFETGPKWLQKIYTKYGKWFAKFISNKPIIKGIIKCLMNIVVNKHL